MRLRQFFLAGFAGLALVVAPAVAQQTPTQPQQQAAEPSPSHLAAAREVLLLAGGAATIDRILPILINDIRRVAVTRPELAKDLDEVLKSIEPEIERQKQQGYAIAARAYAAQLSEADLKETAVFFRTPVGKRYVEALPTITENLINDVTTWSQLVAEYTMTRVRAEMAKRGHQLQ
jgi:hypothetical protein